MGCNTHCKGGQCRGGPLQQEQPNPVIPVQPARALIPPLPMAGSMTAEQVAQFLLNFFPSNEGAGGQGKG